MGSHKKKLQGKPNKGKMWKVLICVGLLTIVCDGVPHHKMETAKTFTIFSGDSTTENHEEAATTKPEEATMEPEEASTMKPDDTTTEDSDLSFFAEWPLFCTALWYPYDSEKCKSARCMPCAESIRASAQLRKQSEGMVSWGCLSRNVGVGFCNHCLGEVRVVKTFGLFSEDSTTESPEETTTMEPEETTTMEPEETTTEESDLSFFADWPLFCTALWYPYDSEKCKSARCMPCAESIRSTAQVCQRLEGSVSPRCLSRNVGAGICTNDCLYKFV